MVNLFGEQYTEHPSRRKTIDKQRRAWEDAFQRWSDKLSQDGNTHLGKCGYGQMCDYCANKTIYVLQEENELLVFPSEKAACEYLGVVKCSISSCYHKGYRCKGYKIQRAKMDGGTE